jgi:hypothetical protein
MPHYGHTMPSFDGVCADCFILGVLRGSVHGEFSIRELKNRVQAQWGKDESLLAEIIYSIERLEDTRRVTATGHQSIIENNVVRLNRNR